jgi:hypothetical protein
VKYFFLAEGWTVGRVWETGGLWNERAWRRKAEIQKMNICITGPDETLWLHQVEDAVVMVEVTPIDNDQVSKGARAIGQVVLRRLITAEQILEWLSSSKVCLERNSIVTRLGGENI